MQLSAHNTAKGRLRKSVTEYMCALWPLQSGTNAGRHGNEEGQGHNMNKNWMEDWLECSLSDGICMAMYVISNFCMAKELWIDHFTDSVKLDNR